MKGMKMPVKPGVRSVSTAERSGKVPFMLRHEQMIRREPNHNVHVITPHGKLQSGRKGRTT